MFIDTPANPNRVVTLCGFVEALEITIWRISFHWIPTEATLNSGTRTVGSLEATTPFLGICPTILIGVTSVDEKLHTFFILNGRIY
jgi:hypothetical protein